MIGAAATAAAVAAAATAYRPRCWLSMSAAWSDCSDHAVIRINARLIRSHIGAAHCQSLYIALRQKRRVS